jgi:methyltransferase
LSSSATVAVLATLGALVVMLAELFVSRANERDLRAMGAVEPEGDVHRVMAGVYPLAFVAMGIEGAADGPVPGTITLAGVGVFTAAKALKYWAISSLGIRWTFRVLVLPNAPLVTRGPYAWLRHPNYVAVIGEFAGFALTVGAIITAMVAIPAFAVLIWRRIAVEEQALGLRSRQNCPS